jgi:hypothetical protein
VAPTFAANKLVDTERQVEAVERTDVEHAACRGVKNELLRLPTSARGGAGSLRGPSSFGGSSFRCLMKIPEPLENPHRAFCTRGCYESFFSCVICEERMERHTVSQKICGKRA